MRGSIASLSEIITHLNAWFFLITTTEQIDSDFSSLGQHIELTGWLTAEHTEKDMALFLWIEYVVFLDNSVFWPALGPLVGRSAQQ